VVKIGGAEGVDIDGATRDAARVVRSGRPLVMVHGASAATDRLANALGHPPRFVTSPSGHQSRRTDWRALEHFIMASSAQNRRIVSRLQSLGVNAIGLSGLDGALIEATRKDAIRVVEDGRVCVLRDDWSGKIRRVNGDLLRSLCAMGYTPVIAPLGLGERGEPLNVDGDRVAASTAAALRAEVLVLLTGVAGILREFPDEATLVRHVPPAELEGALALVGGRMKKKVLAAREALEGGVRRVVIATSRGAAPLRRALDGHGTVLGEPLERAYAQ
jgi:acetylglutamate/LysW-gamma-L-alpha-aminoadipate kinase